MNITGISRLILPDNRVMELMITNMSVHRGEELGMLHVARIDISAVLMRDSIASGSTIEYTIEEKPEPSPKPKRRGRLLQDL